MKLIKVIFIWIFCDSGANFFDQKIFQSGTFNQGVNIKIKEHPVNTVKKPLLSEIRKCKKKKCNKEEMKFSCRSRYSKKN